MILCELISVLLALPSFSIGYELLIGRSVPPFVPISTFSGFPGLPGLSGLPGLQGLPGLPSLGGMIPRLVTVTQLNALVGRIDVLEKSMKDMDRKCSTTDERAKIVDNICYSLLFMATYEEAKRFCFNKGGILAEPPFDEGEEFIDKLKLAFDDDNKEANIFTLAADMGILIGAKVTPADKLVYSRSGIEIPEIQVTPGKEIPLHSEGKVAKLDVKASAVSESLQFTLADPTVQFFYLCQYDIN